MIRLLNKNDTSQCLPIILAQKKISGTTPLSADLHEKYLDKFFNDPEKYKVIGYFEHDVLISWISIGFYETQAHGKFWLVLNLFSDKKRQLFNFTSPEISEIFAEAFNVAESMGVYQYFYCVSEKISKVYERQWAKKNPMNYHGVYELKDIAIIPANTVPESKLYWGLLGEETRPHDMYIKARIRNK